MTSNASKFSFHGDGGELFIIYLGNALLAVITLGIHVFWGKVKVLKFLYRNTEFMGERFEYHGTGDERFIGFLKAAGIFILFGIAMGVVYAGLMFAAGPGIAAILLIILFYAVVLAAIPYVIIGSERYRLSRSSYRSIRFRFTGKYRELLKIYIKGVLLSIITLGFYSPWFVCSLDRFFSGNSRYGNKAFKYNGRGKPLFKIYIKGFLLSIITLGIYGFWFIADFIRFYWNNTEFQGNKFSSTIKGGMLFKNFLKTMLLVIFTLGIGFPWAVIWNMKLTLNTLEYNGEIDFTLIKEEYDAEASALADGINDAAEALDIITG
ncbi:MAG: DUF898 domain-containing protein [Spirochaetes bacterium]|nr:DUF898 domain-containing protein [Spirochaetota bacterium]